MHLKKIYLFVFDSGNLVISDVKPQHSGVYLCRATTPRTRNYTIAAANLTVLGGYNTWVHFLPAQQNKPAQSIIFIESVFVFFVVICCLRLA